MNETTLTQDKEIYAVVDYNFGNGFADRQFKGWVRLSKNDPNRVVARWFRGRVDFNLCNVSDILNLIEVDRPKKQTAPRIGR